MTIIELKEYQKKVAKKANLLSGIFLILFFALLISNLVLVKQLEKYCPDYTWISGIYLVSIFIFMFWSLRKVFTKAKQCLPDCPKCHERIKAPAIPIIIATGNCPMCGEKILDKETKE